ncbi:MAG: hypothetical protein LBV78_01355 [Kitasatospora sp.]|jgi:hypothetical protein|nr:hypothetical protein [Kitasatospora sp.]
MDEASRTARGRTGAATATLVAALVTLIAAVVATLALVGTPAGHPPADPAPSRTTVAAAVHAPDTGPYADDAYVSTCFTLARAQRDPLGERTAPLARVVTVPQGTSAGPARPLRAPPSSGHPLPTTQHTTHDPGRAPPTPSSICHPFPLSSAALAAAVGVPAGGPC